MKKISESLIILSYMQIKTTITNHFTQVRMGYYQNDQKEKFPAENARKRNTYTLLVGMQIIMENNMEIPL